MRQKILSAAIYGVTAISLWTFFDTLDGMEPSNHPPAVAIVQLSRIAIAAVIVFALGCLASAFSLHYGLACGVLAGILSWPYWLYMIATFRWKQSMSLLNSVVGRPELIAMFMLTIASCYTIAQLQVWSRRRAAAGSPDGGPN